MLKEKIEVEGQPCRKCGFPVIRRFTKKKERRKKQNYYFVSYLWCRKCRTIYLLESEKVWINKPYWLKDRETKERLKKREEGMRSAWLEFAGDKSEIIEK